MRPVIRTVLCSIVLMLYAGTTMASAPPPPPAKKKDEKEGPVPGLTGAKLLRCEPGFYPSGNACKPARPGTYVTLAMLLSVSEATVPEGKEEPFKPGD